MPDRAQKFAQDYIEVVPRIVAWYERYPEGRIETSIVEFADDRVTVQARVFRNSEENELPAGIGHSYMAVPGSTPFTRGAELENAETSAVGRALVMAGIPAKQVASADEIAAKRTATPSRVPTEGADPSRDVSGSAPTSSPSGTESVRRGGPDGDGAAPEATDSGNGEGPGPLASGVGDPIDATLRAAAWDELTKLAGSRARARGLLNGWMNLHITAANEDSVSLEDLEMAVNHYRSKGVRA